MLVFGLPFWVALVWFGFVVAAAAAPAGGGGLGRPNKRPWHKLEEYFIPITMTKMKRGHGLGLLV